LYISDLHGDFEMVVLVWQGGLKSSERGGKDVDGEKIYPKKESTFDNKK
jgi:hypothetical protein